MTSADLQAIRCAAGEEKSSNELLALPRRLCGSRAPSRGGAQALCRSFANGKATVAQIETEIRMAAATPRADRAEGATEFDADERGAWLGVQVSLESLSDNPEKRERLLKMKSKDFAQFAHGQPLCRHDGPPWCRKPSRWPVVSGASTLALLSPRPQTAVQG